MTGFISRSGQEGGREGGRLEDLSRRFRDSGGGGGVKLGCPRPWGETVPREYAQQRMVAFCLSSIWICLDLMAMVQENPHGWRWAGWLAGLQLPVYVNNDSCH